jgi:tetratricopeptide (TPR) repeat protein
VKANLDPWDYMRQGNYEQAIEAYTKMIEKAPLERKRGLTRSRGYAYLKLKNFVAALNDFRSATAQGNPRYWSESDFGSQAVCYWWLDQPYEAIAILRHAVIAPYSVFAGALAPALLLYAAERFHDAGVRREALVLLRKHARHKYPSPITLLLLESIDEAEYDRQMPASRGGVMRAREQCQWDFYAALWALRRGDREYFVERMTRCAENPIAIIEEECYLAQWEVDRQFAERPFAGRPYGRSIA